MRSQQGIYPNELVLGFCGELRHKKGLPFMLSALQQVRSQRPACLLVIGDIRHREQASIQEYLASDTPSRRRLLITGQLAEQADVARHLQLCDVVLQPSVWDGLPNAVLEAMSCEKVVVASDAGGIPEVIEHGQSGFLVPKAHLHRLGEAILEVLSLPAEERLEIGRAARCRVSQHFHPDREAADLVAALKLLTPKTS